MVQAVNGGVGHDGHASVHRLGWVVEHGVVVGRGGQAEACEALLRAVHDQEGPVGKGNHAGDDALGGHALDGPVRVRDFGSDGGAIVERDFGTNRRAAADDDSQGGGVGGCLGEQHCCTFHWIRATGEEVVYCAWDVGQGALRLHGTFVKDTGFVVICNEDSAGRKHCEVRIQIVRIGACQVVAVDWLSDARWSR